MMQTLLNCGNYEWLGVRGFAKTYERMGLPSINVLRITNIFTCKQVVIDGLARSVVRKRR